MVVRYSLDTDVTYKLRIASKLKTTPEFLYVTLADDGTEQYQDMLRYIRKKSPDRAFEEDFEKEFYRKFPNSLSRGRLLQLVFASSSNTYEDAFGEAMIEDLAKIYGVPEYLGTPKAVRDFIRNLSRFRKELEKDKQNVKLLSEKYTGIYKKLDMDDENDRVYTDFKPERYYLKVELDLNTPKTVLNVFNSIKNTEEIPLVVCQDFFKVYSNSNENPDFKPDWIKTYYSDLPMKGYKNTLEQNQILLKVASRPVENDRDFVDVFLTVDDESIRVEFQVVLGKNRFSSDQIISKIVSTFPENYFSGPISPKETDVAGLFYFPDTRINTYVLSDLLMNNKELSSLIFVDEKRKATKKRGELQPYLYTHFIHQNTGEISASITQKNVDRGEPEMREQSHQIFPQNSPYVRVRVKGRNISDITFFQKILSKILTIYFEDEAGIVQIYKKFIPEFGKIEEYITQHKEREIEKIAGEIFVKQFSRRCPLKRLPEISTLNAEELEMYENEDIEDPTSGNIVKQQVMKFPRDVDPEQEPILSDGVNQQYYICPNPEFPYPGLQENTLENQKAYPYVPCCFKTDQRKGEKYRKYYYGEALGTRDKKQQDYIITEKQLFPSKFGKLPDNIDEIFNTIFRSRSGEFIRMGVQKDQSSFLSCIITAMQKYTEPDEKSVFLDCRTKDSREKLSQYVSASKQNLYKSSLKEIKTIIMDSSAYFDPRMFSQMLETLFGCTIIVFSKQGLVVPNYIEGYYRYDLKNRPVIFIYENMGSESDRAKYPRCELIVRVVSSKSEVLSNVANTEILFNRKEKIVKNLLTLTELAGTEYIGKTKLNPIDFSVYSFFVHATTQFIDSYGKVRCFLVDGFYILTSPLPPLGTKGKIIKNKPFYTEKNLSEFSKAIRFLEKHGLTPSSLAVRQKLVMEVNTNIGGIEIVIPIVPIELKMVGDYRLTGKTVGVNQTNSKLTEFRLHRKNSHCLVEYALWLFSNFLRLSSGDQGKDFETLLRKFGKSMVLIPDFVYPKIEQNFDINSKIVQNGSLIVDSDELRNRLIYVLYLYGTRSPFLLAEFYKKKTISNYYKDLSDFDLIPNQLVLQGEKILENWYREKSLMTLYTEIKLGRSTPYMLKFLEKIYLAQPASSLQGALAIGLNWITEGYNTGFYTPKLLSNNSVFEYTLYTQNSDGTWKKTRFMGENVGKIEILGFRVAGDPSFVVLLE